ncbi:hypothetical protein CEXT_199431 [Caerostris extrusa]|uniref:Uncharacterized protein n=1 Tax=Caerostris extrusa TaxID=172846 RepID=A0AAV4WSM2_CAEEX|nr:hypothetical protein CEXT_199431 [Caerostris extrusa]
MVTIKHSPFFVRTHEERALSQIALVKGWSTPTLYPSQCQGTLHYNLISRRKNRRAHETNSLVESHSSAATTQTSPTFFWILLVLFRMDPLIPKMVLRRTGLNQAWIFRTQCESSYSPF